MITPPEQCVRLAARAMHENGLAHAYGHVSARLDEDAFLASPPAPLGLDGAAPLIRIEVDGELPPAALGELRLHQSIYRARPDVGGICRVQPPAVMALSALGRAPRVLHGLGAYFAPSAPFWPNPGLVRAAATAEAVARALGDANAIVLRGNGAVAVGASLEIAACHAFFLEDAARLELALGGLAREALVYTPDEARTRAVSGGGLYERMWAYLTRSAGPPHPDLPPERTLP